MLSDSSERFPRRGESPIATRLKAFQDYFAAGAFTFNASLLIEIEASPDCVARSERVVEVNHDVGTIP